MNFPLKSVFDDYKSSDIVIRLFIPFFFNAVTKCYGRGHGFIQIRTWVSTFYNQRGRWMAGCSLWSHHVVAIVAGSRSRFHCTFVKSIESRVCNALSTCRLQKVWRQHAVRVQERERERKESIHSLQIERSIPRST